MKRILLPGTLLLSSIVIVVWLFMDLNRANRSSQALYDPGNTLVVLPRSSELVGGQSARGRGSDRLSGRRRSGEEVRVSGSGSSLRRRSGVRMRSDESLWGLSGLPSSGVVGREQSLRRSSAPFGGGGSYAQVPYGSGRRGAGTADGAAGSGGIGSRGIGIDEANFGVLTNRQSAPPLNQTLDLPPPEEVEPLPAPVGVVPLLLLGVGYGMLLRRRH